MHAWSILALMGLIGSLSAVGCARAQVAPPGAESGGSSAESSDSARASSGTGGQSQVATAPPIAEMREDALTPTDDCAHPQVKEQCEGDYCRIEPGCFIMGSPPSEFGRALVAEDQVQVTLTHAFWMGRTEVTRAQWKRSGLPVPKLVQLNGKRECLDPDCPQGNAVFYDMLRYANRLSEMEKLKPCYVIAGSSCTGTILTNDFECPEVRINGQSPYECEGYRLPTEGEWEYAARAGTTTAFPSGEITAQSSPSDCAPDARLDPIGWYCMNSPDQAQRVAQKQPNGFGLHDMHGNMMELVNDLYGPSGYLVGPAGAAEGPLVNPTGAVNGAANITKTAQRPFRAVRGGAHNLPPVLAKSSRRLGGIPDSDSASNIGFRVARTIR